MRKSKNLGKRKIFRINFIFSHISLLRLICLKLESLIYFYSVKTPTTVKMAYEEGEKREFKKDINVSNPSKTGTTSVSNKNKATETVETVESIENTPEPSNSVAPEVESTENKDDSKDPNDYLRIRKGDKLASTAKRQRLLQNPQDTWVCFYNMIQTNERYRINRYFHISCFI